MPDTFDKTACAQALVALVGEDSVRVDEPMSAHTTFQIGGPADVLVEPGSAEEAAAVLDWCSAAEVPVFVMGNGSDLLVGDKGMRGVVVLFGPRMAKMTVEYAPAGGEGDGARSGRAVLAPATDAVGRAPVPTGRVTAEAGALLADVAELAASAGLGGMEPISGIPSSVGGACFMNAGAYGGETAGVLESVLAYAPGAEGMPGELGVLTVDELDMGYRRSRVAADGLVVLSATFALTPADPAEIRASMDDFRQRRAEKQPLELPSAGSTFKRPEGYFAGKLIMDAGLRGARVGAAQVSEKHCGFVVNAGGATAADVNGLIEHVRDEVERRFGVRLEPEVRRVGEF